MGIFPQMNCGIFQRKSFSNQLIPVGWVEGWELGHYPSAWQFLNNPWPGFLSGYIFNTSLKDKNLGKLHIL
jgi:hypothetical protein